MKDSLPSKPGKNYSQYARYSGMATQMILVLLAAVFGGKKIDEYFGLRFPAFTLGLSLFGLFAVIYILIRSVTKK